MGLFSKKHKPITLHALDELKPLVESGKPVLIDFFQTNCAPCKVMDGVINELAAEYPDSAHVVKVDVTKVHGAAQMFNVRSTPTFVLIGNTPKKKSAKSQRKAAKKKPQGGGTGPQARWRAHGLVKKDQLVRVLEGNGATRT